MICNKYAKKSSVFLVAVEVEGILSAVAIIETSVTGAVRLKELQNQHYHLSNLFGLPKESSD